MPHMWLAHFDSGEMISSFPAVSWTNFARKRYSDRLPEYMLSKTVMLILKDNNVFVWGIA